MRLKGDIIITDPAYVIPNDKWGEYADALFNEDVVSLGLSQAIIKHNGVGDGMFGTYNDVNNEELGTFCADTGMIGVLLLDEVLKFNPDFNFHLEKKWLVTWVKDFDGDVDIVNRDIKYWDEEDKCYIEDNIVSVVGVGNINFSTE